MQPRKEAGTAKTKGLRAGLGKTGLPEIVFHPELHPLAWLIFSSRGMQLRLYLGLIVAQGESRAYTDRIMQAAAARGKHGGEPLAQ